MLIKNPSKRATITDLMDDPFLTNHGSELIAKYNQNSNQNPELTVEQLGTPI